MDGLNPDLTEREKAELALLLWTFQDTFVEPGGRLGQTRLEQPNNDKLDEMEREAPTCRPAYIEWVKYVTIRAL